MASQYKSGQGSSRRVTPPLETGLPIWMARIVSMIRVRRYSGVMPAAPGGTWPDRLSSLPVQALGLLSGTHAAPSPGDHAARAWALKTSGALVSKLLFRQGRTQAFNFRIDDQVHDGVRGASE